MTVAEIKRELERCSHEERLQIFRHLRKEFTIHQLERDYRVPAEVILEAIARAPDLTQRGFRGVIAEAIFIQEVMPHAVTKGWRDTTPPNTENPSFDARLQRADCVARIQVKTQRKQGGTAMEKDFANSGRCFVVETQRTRSGKTNAREDTRPYRDDEFDILAVCMFPSTNEWTTFRFALVRDLLRRPANRHLLAVLQPVPREPSLTGVWSTNLVDKLEELAAMPKSHARGRRTPR